MYVLIIAKYTEEFSDVAPDHKIPCSHEILQQTVHGVIYTKSCSDDTVVDMVTNRLSELLPELKSYIYSIIICPDVTPHSNISDCSYSIYVAEVPVDTENYSTIPNDDLTRKSLATLMSELTVSAIAWLNPVMYVKLPSTEHPTCIVLTALQITIYWR